MIRGSIPALITPFTNSGEVDFSALEALVEWHVQEGSDALVVCGTTGESPTLSTDELLKVFECVISCSKKRLPIIAGTGCNDTRKTLELTKRAKALGADAALIIVPYYNRPTPQGCLMHYQEAARADLPLILYHHPGRTGVKLSPKSLAQISEIPQILAIKEASGDLDLATELTRLTSKPLFSGDDTLTLPFLSIGAIGTISIIANVIPRAWKQCISSSLQGNRSEAKAIFDRYYGLCKSLVLETNPQCVKYALSLMGKCTPRMRLPLIEPQEATKREIQLALAKAGVVLERKALADCLSMNLSE